jgi:Domain of unknown function (DUF5655)
VSDPAGRPPGAGLACDDVASRSEAESDPETLFAGDPEGLAIFYAVEHAVSELGDVTLRVTKSQAAFRRRRGFAYVWPPGRYLTTDVPAVLSLAVDRDLASPRVKEVSHPTRNVYMHHIELRSASEVDSEVLGLLRTAFEAAG